ncbi:plasmodesmata-located protein 7 [Lycium barbarum]|uniref:plasmodesmata-located protein 7 n=1 Tax=Lycium barbarum TaxID=112863 RepID=UPI00293E9CEE|nr:plasmodesmata-located protein 7 [Lycium barbarum]
MTKILHFLLVFMYIFFSLFFPIIFSDSSVDGFIYGGCSQIKYSPSSPYESNLNSLLTSLVNSATYSSYNKYSIVGSTQQDMINGLYQCRGDLSMPECATCLARSVSQLTELCPQTCGGAVQLQGCFVKYDNSSFLGSEDKTVVMKKCGPSNGFDLDEMGRRDAVLGSLMGGNGLYRVGGSKDVQGMAQCVGDLSMSQCQDCLYEAIGRLKKECGGGVYGDMFLGKCYARYTTSGAHLYAKPNHHDSHSESEKTFALIIGLLAGVALLIVFLTFMRRIFARNGK